MFKIPFLAATLALFTPFALPAQAQQGPDTIVVLDVSNSMWGQIGGVSKIEIAREVIADLVGDINPNARFGLVAYGHREKANCQDIELVLPVGPLNAATFSAAVNSLVPRGRTPLTDAVRQAAEVLNYQDTPSRIILVSDGLESCDADPCALAAELARGGVDFTAHVVGFDVAGIEDQSQLSCLADQTGGLYLTADSTEELTAALTTMMVEASAPPPLAPTPPAPTPIAPIPFSVTLLAPTEVETGAAVSATWRANARTGDQILLIPENGGTPLASVDATHGSPANFTAPAEVGNIAVVYVNSEGEALSRVDITVVQKVSLNGPRTAVAGSPVQITWAGPGADRDFVTIVAADALAGSFNDYAYAELGSPVTINTPDTVGEFEIRYVSASSSTILARQPITLTPPTVSLSAAETINVGGQFEVQWVGPNNERDFITIVDIGALDNAYNSYAYTTEGSPALITALDTPGSYEIRYVSGQSNTVLARRLVTLEEVVVSLTAVETAIAGSRIEITWKGPNAAQDFITIVAQDTREGGYNGYAYTTDGTTLQVLSPDVAGEYEIRYVSGQSNATLATQLITLVAVEISLVAPETAVAGADVSITWNGPNNESDFITIVAPNTREGGYKGYAYTSVGATLQVQAPDVPGDFEIRYVSGQSNATLARVPLSLTAPTILLEAQGLVRAGMALSVEWLGPDNTLDYLSIAVVGSADSDYISYAYTRSGSPASFKAPAGGNYELRYVSGQSEIVLARVPLAVAAD